MIPDRIDELIALAALGELSPDEQIELDVAAERDPTVAVELDDALEAAAALQRPQAEDPPPALRNSVLAAIAATLQEPVGGASDPALDLLAPVVAAPVVSLDAARTRRRRSTILLAAAAVALFFVGGVALVATDDASPDLIAAVVEAPDATTRSLSGDLDGLAVIYSESEGALVIEGDRLAVLDDTATYQLWLVDDDGATSVGTFRPDADGRVSQRFADADPTGLVLGVTQEPAGGSESPTLPILASA